MELLQSCYFLTAAEYQHTTKAVEHLQITQLAFSQAIHRSEAELGIPLSERKGRGIELNEAGRLLQKRLIPLISALDRISGELRIGQYRFSYTIHPKLLVASTLITNRITTYRSLWPDVNLQLSQSDATTDYDLCVSTIRSDVKSDEHSDYMVMLGEDLYLAVSTHLPYRDKDSICLADINNADYTCLAGSRPIRQICSSYSSEASFTPKTISESDTVESMHNLIAVGLGIGFWPQYSWGSLSAEWDPLAPQSPVKLLPIKDQVCRRQIILMCSPHGKGNPIVRDFCDFLIQNSKWLQEIPTANFLFQITSYYSPSR